MPRTSFFAPLAAITLFFIAALAGANPSLAQRAPDSRHEHELIRSRLGQLPFHAKNRTER